MSVKDVVDLILPAADATGPTLTRWRYLVATLIALGYGCILCLYIITARASELDNLKVAVYVPTMEKMHERYCLSDNQETRVFLRQQIVDYQRQYLTATGTQYPLEDCDEIRERSST